jgi:hypothetical protein
MIVRITAPASKYGGKYGTAAPGHERLVLGHELLGEVQDAPTGSGFARGDLVSGWQQAIERQPGDVKVGSPDGTGEIKMSTPKPKIYDRPTGGWGSLEGMAKVELEGKAGPSALQTLAIQNKAGGHMCTSCAWAKPPEPHVAEFCENGAKATIWDLTAKRCTPEFFAGHTVRELWKWSDHDLELVGRLTEPLRYDASSDCYVRVSWDEAFAAIGQALKRLEPKSTTFYTSGKAALEASYLYALFARMYGHNNLPDSSNMCHETTSVGLKKVTGSGVGTCQFQDLEHCDAIFYPGQNPGGNSPRILHPLKDAVERGCKIVALNPLRERGLLEFVDPQNPWQMTLGKSTKIAHQCNVIFEQPGRFPCGREYIRNTASDDLVGATLQDARRGGVEIGPLKIDDGARGIAPWCQDHERHRRCFEHDSKPFVPLLG